MLMSGKVKDQIISGRKESVLSKMVRQIVPNIFVGKKSGRIYEATDAGSHLIVKGFE